MTKERLSFELKKRNISVINTAKRDELVKELELGLANETEMIQDGKKRIYKKKIILKQMLITILKKIFPKIKKIKILYGKYYTYSGRILVIC